MGRAENIAVFQDTEQLCSTNIKLKNSIKNSWEGQKLILETDTITISSKEKYSENAKVIVSKKRSFEAAGAYKDMKVCVHNFASASHPGGGVTKGSSAQEEALCRISSLYFCLNTNDMWGGFYKPHTNARNPIHNDDIIYTPEITVFKSDTNNPVLMDESQWYSVNVITCAAPNLRENPSNIYNSGDGDTKVSLSDSELYDIHVKRLSRIMDVALAEGNEAIILGAFGCGAFLNNPEVVSKASKKVAEEFSHAFKVIEFAVYCSPRDDSNYRIFDKEINGKDRK